MQEFSQPLIQFSYKCIGIYLNKGLNTIYLGLKPLKVIRHLATCNHKSRKSGPRMKKCILIHSCMKYTKCINTCENAQEITQPLDTNCHTIYWILFTYRIQHYILLLNPLKIICPLASIISKLAIIYVMFSCSATVLVSGCVSLHLSELGLYSYERQLTSASNR